jgi:pyruvate dehydrogenase E1 component alpha subunit
MNDHPDSPLLDPDQTIVRVLGDDGMLDAVHDPHLSDDEIIALHAAMVRTRIIDERLVSLQRQGRIGFHIGSLGEEATIIGSAHALRPNDFIFPAYREFGAALLRGFPLQSYFDNMFGNRRDPARGRQMPDHYTSAKTRFASISSPIGTQIIHAVGFAVAARIRGDDVVTLAYFGEGATSSNDFHNGMNFAGVMRAPTVMLCRNNGWAISVPPERQTAARSFAEKGRAYGVRYARCDGNDVFAVIRVTRDAVQRAASGGGPTLVECLTYRMAGHSTSDDPTIYRTADDLEAWRRRDPIGRLRAFMVSRGLWDDDKQGELERGIDAEIGVAIEQAESAGPPPLESMFEDVYAAVPRHLQEQREQLLSGPRPSLAHH